jgi:hypothetical protein
MGVTSFVHGLRLDIPGVKGGDGTYDPAITVVSGTRTIHTLDPDDGDADSGATNEFYSSATGCLAFRITPLPQAEADYSLLLAVIFGWSTTEADVAAVNVQMGLADAAITSPSTADGSAANGTNVGVIVPGSNAPTLATAGVTWYGDLDWILWDGTTKIKTIAARTCNDVFTGGLLLEVIE